MGQRRFIVEITCQGEKMPYPTDAADKDEAVKKAKRFFRSRGEVGELKVTQLIEAE